LSIQPTDLPQRGSQRGRQRRAMTGVAICWTCLLGN
jgi:hypothetical protein